MEQRRFFDASNLKDDVIAVSLNAYDHVHALWSPSRHSRDPTPFGGDGEKSVDPSLSLRHVILDLQRKIDSGALKGVQIEYFDLVSRRCIALCRGEREKALGVIDSGFTLTGPEGDDLSLRVLIVFPVGPIGNQSESANLMPKFGLVPRGPKLARLSETKIDHISRSLQRLCANSQLPVVTLLENCLRFVAQELTLAMNKQFEALKMKRVLASAPDANQPGRGKASIEGGNDAGRKARGSEMFKLEIRPEEKQERSGEPTASVAARQPCPAYCGARFSGGGVLVHFDNFNDFVHVQIWKAGAVESSEDAPADISFPRTYADLKERIEVAKHSMMGTGSKGNASPRDERFSGFSSGGISVDGSEVKLSPRKSLSPRSSDGGDTEKKMSDRGSVSNVLLNDELNESDLFDWHFEEPEKDVTAQSQTQTPGVTQGGARGDGQGSTKIEGAPSLDLDLDVFTSLASEFSSRETSVSTPVVTLFTLAGTALCRYLAESYTFGDLSCRRHIPRFKRRRASWRGSQGSQSDSEHPFVQVLLADKDYLEGTTSQDPVTSAKPGKGSLDDTKQARYPQTAIITKRERAFLRYLASLPQDDYKDVRYGYHPIETKFAMPTKNNHHIATLAGEPDLVTLWTVLRLITDTRVATKEVPAAASTLWAYHPCGRQLIREFFKHYSKQHDVQTLATVACVIQDLEQTSAWSQTESLIDPDWRATCDGYKRGYADVLQRLGYYITRAEVLKYISQPSPLNATNRENGAKSTFLTIASTDEKPFICSVCQVRVNGLVTFCKHCSHGGHSHHMNEWFHEYEVCPTGCGCVCATSVF